MPRRDIELQEIMSDSEDVSADELVGEEGGGSTDGSTRPVSPAGGTTDDSTRPLTFRQVRQQRPPRGEQFTTALGEKEKAAKSASSKQEKEKADTKDTGDDAELTFKDVKNALSNAQWILRTAFFAAPAYFLVILSQRPYPPPWIERTPLIKKKLQDDLTSEMVVAFTVVTGFHVALLILEFVYTRSPRIRRGYASIGPMALAVFVSSWMVMYTLHVPFIHQRSWHWAMMICFIVLNTSMH